MKKFVKKLSSKWNLFSKLFKKEHFVKKKNY